MAKKQLTYKEAFEELQIITQRIKANEISIDELIVEIKRARELLDYCKATLRSVEELIGDSESEDLMSD